jgi:drug/metabolite transporter (DMT)-like permease
VVLGVLLAAAYGFQTAGLERTTVSSTGFITGLYVVLTPLLALVLFRQSTTAVVWIGAALAVIGFALLSGIDVGGADRGPARARECVRDRPPDPDGRALRLPGMTAWR